ncbi:MAG: hypothetical protein ACOY4I_04975 [Bacillota bacterium]
MKFINIFKKFLGIFFEGTETVKLDLILPELKKPEVHKTEY